MAASDEIITLNLTLDIYGFMKAIDPDDAPVQKKKLRDATVLLLKCLDNKEKVSYEEIYEKYDGNYGDLVDEFVKVVNGG